MADDPEQKNDTPSAGRSRDHGGDTPHPEGLGARVRLGLRALRHRNFQLFFSGQLISLIGTWMQNVAQSWLVYRLTGSSVLLGAVGFANQIPIFFVAPLGGILADRKSRHRMVVATQTASMLLAFALAALTLTHRIRVAHLFVLAALLGVVNGFDIPARQSFLVEMVGRDDLISAIALNSSMFNGARIVGPAIAGLLVATIGEGWCFFANAVSYVAVIVGLLLMRVAPAVPKSSGSPLAALLEGFRYVRETAPIRALLLLLGLTSLAVTPYAVLMPIFADRVLGGGVRGLGILMGASGIGALAGALSLAFKGGLGGLGRWVAISCAGAGASLVLFGLSRSFWLSAALLLPVGYSLMVQMASSNTLVQSMVPDALRGRVMSVYSMMFMGMAPLGALTSGAVADKLGAPLSVVLGGAAAVGGAAIFGMRLPVLRVAARKLVVAQGLAGGEPAEALSAPPPPNQSSDNE